MKSENYIEPISGFQTTTIPLSQLYDLFVSKKIQTYAVWLQRLKQESKWSAKDWLKARSYLYRLLSSGKTSKSIYTVVDIDLLITKLKEQVDFLSPEGVKNNIFEQMIGDLKDLKLEGCAYILLDGQNRLEYPIKRFFESKLQFYLSNKISKEPKSINFIIDDTKYEKQSFLYKDLSDAEKDLIDNIEVVLAIGNHGEIDEYIEDLIDDNSGESWNDFERAITSLRTVPYLVNTALSKGKGNVPEFKLIMERIGKLSGEYHVEKKGYNKILCELMQYDYNGHIKLDYEVVLDETKKDSFEKSFANVKGFFKLLAKEKRFNWTKGNTNVFESKEMLRNFYMLIQALGNGSVGYKIKYDDIKQLKIIYDDFSRFDSFKRDRKQNAGEYVAAGLGTQQVPAPNTWIWAQKDIRTEFLEIRKKEISKFISDHIEGWVNNHVFKRLDRNEVTDNIKKKVILDSKGDFHSSFGQGLNKFVDQVSVDHLEQFGRGGSNDPSNLVATTAVSNSSRVK